MLVGIGMIVGVGVEVGLDDGEDVGVLVIVGVIVDVLLEVGTEVGKELLVVKRRSSNTWSPVLERRVKLVTGLIHPVTRV